MGIYFIYLMRINEHKIWHLHLVLCYFVKTNFLYSHYILFEKVQDEWSCTICRKDIHFLINHTNENRDYFRSFIPIIFWSFVAPGAKENDANWEKEKENDEVEWMRPWNSISVFCTRHAEIISWNVWIEITSTFFSFIYLGMFWEQHIQLWMKQKEKIPFQHFYIFW